MLKVISAKKTPSPFLNNVSPTGIHYLLSFFGCDAKQIDSTKFWKKILSESVSKTDMKIIGSIFHRFTPHGITGLLLLSSSHLSIHTWPEYGYVACDLFSCSKKGNNEKVINSLLKNIKHTKYEIRKLKRGYVIQ